MARILSKGVDMRPCCKGSVSHTAEQPIKRSTPRQVSHKPQMRSFGARIFSNLVFESHSPSTACSEPCLLSLVPRFLCSISHYATRILIPFRGLSVWLY